MHPALWHLLWLDILGGFRALLQVRKNWRKLGLLVFMLAFAGFFITMRNLQPSAAMEGRFGSAMPFWALLYLSATWLTASADRGLVMRPAEIHFIVGGPFRHRDVITNSLVRLALRAAVSASVLSLIGLAYLPDYLSSFVGMWLLISVSLLVGMIVSLASKRSSQTWVTLARRIMTAAILLALVGTLWQSLNAVRQAGETPKISTIAASAIQTPIGGVILPVLEWMFRPLSCSAFVAETVPLLPLRLLVLSVLVCIVYLLGRDYREVSTRRTDKSMSKRQAALRSGSAPATQWTKRLSLPLLPRMGGIGTVAWMQSTHGLRIFPRYMLFTGVVVLVAMVIPLTLDRNRLTGTAALGWYAGLTSYADFLLLLQLPLGFLGPLAQREQLKALPIANWRLVLGQLAGPFLPLMGLHLALTLLFLGVAKVDRWQLLVMAISLLPAAFVIVANINLLAAWGIIRPRALQQRDAFAAGRAMLSVWIFFATLLPAVFAGAVGAAVAWIATDGAIVALMIGAAVMVSLSSFIYLLLLSWSFSRWQPSVADSGNEETEHDR